MKNKNREAGQQTVPGNPEFTGSEWRKIFDSIPDPASVINKHFEIIWVNKLFAGYTKTPPEALAGRKCHEVFHGLRGPVSGCPLSSCLRLKKAVTQEILDPLLMKYFTVSVSPVFSDSGGNRSVECVVHVMRDITERKKVEEALMQSENKFKTLAQKSPNMIFINKGGRIVYTNDRCTEVMGYSKKELFSDDFNFLTLIAPEHRDIVMANFRRHMISGDIEPYEYNLVTKDGRTLTAIHTTKLIDYDGGKAILGIITDITDRIISEEKLKKSHEELEKRVQERTADIVKANRQLLLEINERKRIEEELRSSERRFRSVATSTTDLIWEGDVRYNVLHWHGDIDHYLGYGPGEFPRTISGHLDAVHPEDRGALLKSIERAVAAGEEFFAEYRIRRKDGTYRFWDERGKAVGFDNGKAVKWVGSVTDITDRRLAEEEVLRSEERYRTTFQAAGLGIVNLDTGGRFISVNKKTCEIFGYTETEMLNRHFNDFTHPEEREKSLAQFKHAVEGRIEKVSFERRYIHKNGKTIWTNLTGTVLCNQNGDIRFLIGIIEDITEKKRLAEEAKHIQSKLIHTNKMTSLGTLVSGIAHEINNPNSFIMSNAGLLHEIWNDALRVLSEYGAGNGEFVLGGINFSELKTIMPKLLSGITDGSERIKNIVDNLRNFTRPDSVNHNGEADVNQVVNSAVTILNAQIRKCTDVFRVDLMNGLPSVRGSAQQLEQVVINLMINSLQALPDRGKGVRISTSHDKKSGHVVIKVRDQGAGMSEDILERATEPFFTTKLESGGTGLGLSISYAIIKEHNGSLGFRSRPGEGTTATVKLPACP
ncbi:MAG: PAS domain S-box protein [Nitrospirae bacterium]|nr:PAS domain S-box protein [Nitrospirota bacterium]